MKMNGFELMSNGYRYSMERGDIEREVAEKEIRVLDFLATCDTDDLCSMVDSTAFNDIILGYARYAVEISDIDEEAKKKVRDQLRWIFDLKTAREVL